MSFQIIVHLIITFMWMLLNESYTIGSFVVGLFVGGVILFLLRKFLPGTLYLRRIRKIIALAWLFLKELISSNIDIIKLVYQPNLDVEPGIFAYPTELEKDWQITLLANLITLTPGTLSVAISPDNRTLYIHAMHIDNIQDSVDSIKHTFERAILEVSR